MIPQFIPVKGRSAERFHEEKAHNIETEASCQAQTRHCPAGTFKIRVDANTSEGFTDKLSDSI
jgi:hypothetical protein